MFDPTAPELAQRRIQFAIRARRQRPIHKHSQRNESLHEFPRRTEPVFSADFKLKLGEPQRPLVETRGGRTAFSSERSHSPDLTEEYVEFNNGAVSDPTSMGADCNGG